MENIRPELTIFLRQHFDLDSVILEKIPGDAGLREYYRIIRAGQSYIIMDCPVSYNSIEPFIKIAQYLKNHGYSSPEIINYDIKSGFIILEDFGNLTIKNHLLQARSDHLSRKLYFLMVDLLVSFSKMPCPADLLILDITRMQQELELFCNWYFPYIHKRELSQSEKLDFEDIWQSILLKLAPTKNGFIFRDYHTENIMHLTDKQGIHALGLLDFQDAVIGPIEYDLVSLLEDARIEVPRDLALELLEYFAQKVFCSKESIILNYHILGAQRNSRILGVFARKLLRDNNDNYLQYLPLILKYLSYDLSHPELGDLKKYYQNIKII